jgi:hypothetical protein
MNKKIVIIAALIVSLCGAILYSDFVFANRPAGVKRIEGRLFGFNGTSWRRVRIDTSTRSLQAIDYAHHEVHSGSSFVVSDVQAVDTTTMQWMVTTPNTTKWAHMIFAFDCTGEVQIVITEGADRNGTNALVEINNNRNSATTATTVMHRAVSGGTTDGAVTIFSHRSGSTGVGSKTVSAGGGRAENEFVLKQNTKYIVTITTYAAVYVSAIFDFYEHTDKTP